ncbi:HlyD family secretion protein [Acuticoccus sp. I52.16.1]|nr:HlyD family secretion protein [Acuticoccus sp. I52.16.1]UOM36552.1 HlyD family secretion protein [Acuticoccus sp. I52.16.1]
MAGVLAVLYAWHLPPFTSTVKLTEDATVRGTVTTLAPEIAGRVAEVRVVDFQPVSAGDVLVKIEDASYREKLAQAEAAVAMQKAALAGIAQDKLVAQARISSAEAGVHSAKAQLEVAQDNLDRAQQLQSRGVTTARAAQEARLARDQASAALEQAAADAESARQSLAALAATRQSLEAAVANAESAVEIARINLADTQIKAPTDGRLGEVGARVGQYVTPGTRLVSLVAKDVWVVANFKETEVADLVVGQRVTITVDALNDMQINGTIERFSPAMGSEFSLLPSSNATGNFIKITQRLPIRIAIERTQPAYDLLAPGMSVVARVETAPPAPEPAVAMRRSRR